jgi:GMP synthase (glutamine-hydrolysing)
MPSGWRRKVPRPRFVLVVQHEQVEGLGTIAESLAEVEVEARYLRAFAGATVPHEIGEASGLIVMGGSMGVYDAPRYPFLRDEMRLIESALRTATPILGICLGSQLLARVLGAEVAPAGQKEIGWFDITLSESAQSDPLWSGISRTFPAFHWHGDVFPLPAGATHLASSAMTPRQAFRVGRAYGLLFHLEVTAGIVRDMIGTWPEELREEQLAGQEIIRAADQLLPPMREIAQTVFHRWTKSLESLP